MKKRINRQINWLQQPWTERDKIAPSPLSRRRWLLIPRVIQL